MTSRVLLVEDDGKLGRQIRDRLEREGFATQWLRDGETAMKRSPKGFALLVLDLVLPGAHGLEVLARWRERSDVPVLIISGMNTADLKVRALELGADDYLTKPFWIEELVARVRARLRRPLLLAQDVIHIGPIAIDLAARIARLEGLALALTCVEFDLLAALARRAGAAIARNWLVENVLDPRRRGDARTLDVHVSRLRKKLGLQGHRIATVWGIGYRLSVEGAS